MKRLLFLYMLIVAAITLNAQDNFSEDWGRVTNFEMTMSEFAEDKEAEALVIYDLGEYRFATDYQKGFQLVMTRKTKIKILKQAGEKYANFDIQFYTGGDDWETVSEIKATTFNWDGNNLTKTELDPKGIFEEKVNDKIRLKKVALSNVKEGSVIEYSYTITTPYYFNMREWDFQKKIPVLHSELQYRAIPYYEYSYIMKGASRFDKMESEVDNTDKRFRQLEYKEMVWTFGMNNLPAFRDEEFITSSKNHMVSMLFQISKIYNPHGGERAIMSTWPQLATDFSKDADFGGYIKNSAKEAKKILPTLDIEGKSQLEQAKIITKHVKSMYNWNRFYGKYATTKVSAFMKQKTGSAAEINLFLTGLLQAAGLDANGVAISTRENGAISKLHPFVNFFNYVIAEVNIDGKKYFLDATESLLDFDELPERCIHVEGLVAKPKVEEWIFTEQKGEAVTDKEYTIKVDVENMKMNVDANYTASGYNAYRYRAAYLGKMDDLKKYMKEEISVDVNGDIKVTNYDETDKPFSFNFAFESAIEGTGEKLFINPFCNLAISENPFKQTKRTLPVDLIYFRGIKYKSVIEIPKGYVVESLPKSSKHNSPLFTFEYSAKEVDGKIEVVSSYAYKKNVYPAQDYNRLKMTIGAIINHIAEMVVLKKQE